MAIVGDAFVRVRVISNGLSRDIADNVRSSFRGAGDDVDRDARRMGENAGQSAGDGFERAGRPRFRQATDRIANDFRTRFRDRFRSAYEAVTPDAARGMAESFSTRVRREFDDRVAPAFREGVRNSLRDIDRGIDFGKFRNTARELSNTFGKEFNLGIGAARMGPALLGVLLAATPSVTAGAAQLATALAAQLVTTLSALGPGIAGALGVATAGLATLALNFGLLMLAFKAKSEELNQIKIGFVQLGNEIGQALAPGLARGLGDLLGSLRGILPKVNDLLQTTGDRFGEIATKIGNTISSSQNLDRIRGILSTNNEFLSKFGDGLAGLTDAFLILFNAAKPFIDYLGDGIKKLGEWASNSLATAEANGQLASFMENLLDKFKQLMGVIGDFSKGIGNIFKAAYSAGGPLMDRIADIAQRFRDWTESESGQSKMVAFFEKADVLAQAVFKLIGDIGKAWGNAFINADTGPILEVLRIIGEDLAPAIGELFNQFQEGAGENLVKAIDNIAGAFQRLADNGMIEKAAELISGVIEMITGLLDTDFGAQVLGWLIPLALFGGTLSSLIGPIVSVVSALASGPILTVVAVLGAIVGAFVLMYQKSEAFRDAIGRFVEVLRSGFMSIWEKIQPKIEKVWDSIQRLAEAIGNRLGPVIDALKPVFEAVFSFIGDTLAAFMDILSGVIDFVTALINGDWSAVWEAAKNIFASVWNGLGDVVSGALNIVWSLIQTIGGGIVAAMTYVGEGIKAAASAALEGVKYVFRVALDFVLGLVDGFTTWFSDKWNSFVTGWQEYTAGVSQWWNETWQGISDFFMTIWNGIWSFFENIITTIVTWATTKWSEFVTGWNSYLDGVRLWWEQTWNSIWTTLQAIWSMLVGWFNGQVEFWSSTFSAALTGIRDFFVNTWNGIWAFFEGLISNLVSWATAKWQNFVQGWNAYLDNLKAWWNQTWDNVWSTVNRIVSNIVSWIEDRFNDVLSFMQSTWQSIYDNIIEPIQNAASDVVQFAQDIYNGVVDKAQQAINWVINTWNSITSFFTKPIEEAGRIISSVVETIRGVIQGIWDFVTQKASEIKDAVGLSRSLQDQLVNDPLNNQGRINDALGLPPKMPALAEGGVIRATRGGVMALIGEGGRDERVEPLDRNGLSRRDLAIISTMMRQISPTANVNSNQQVIVQIGEKSFTDFVVKIVEAKDEQTVRKHNRGRRVQ